MPGLAPDALAGASIKVGSKVHNESVILGKIAVSLFSSAGAHVQDLTSIPGSTTVRAALMAGDVVFSFDYIGTGWITYLGHDDPIPDVRKQYEALRDEDTNNGVSWLEPSAVNNTYSFAVTGETAKKHGLENLSDMGKLPPDQQVFCVDAEFAGRNDGFEPMLRAYGLQNAQGDRRRLMDVGAIYAATAGGQCTFGEVYTTDGRIQALGLKVLADDRGFFPKYNLSAMTRTAIVERYPALRRLAHEVGSRLDNTKMMQLNARVDVDGEDPGTVAYDWLKAKGLIGT